MDVFLGRILLLPHDFTPGGLMDREGQLLAIASNPALFNLSGTRFGGDGVIDFALPDLGDQAPLADSRYCISVEGISPVRPSAR